MEKDDISLTPMAIPMLSGPGSISLLIGIIRRYRHWYDYLVVSGTVIALGAVTGFILFVAPYLFKVIGQGGLNAISRIMGFLVMAIGIQFVVNGITGIIASLG
jgi:multiple antibiotic resistance protein